MEPDEAGRVFLLVRNQSFTPQRLTADHTVGRIESCEVDDGASEVDDGASEVDDGGSEENYCGETFCDEVSPLHM